MAWTNPTTWTTGQVPSAADFNAHIRDNLNAMGNHEGWSTYAVTVICTGTTDPEYQDAYGQYLRVGNLVICQWRAFAHGGNGAYCVTLPVNGNFDNNLRAGSGCICDAGDAWTLVHYSSSTNASYVKLMWNAKTADGIVTHNSPAAWYPHAGDYMGGQLIYRAAG